VYQAWAVPLLMVMIAILGLAYLAPAHLHRTGSVGRGAASAKGPGSAIAIDVPAPPAEHDCSMTPTTLSSTALLSVEADVPRARRARRLLRLPLLRRGRRAT